MVPLLVRLRVSRLAFPRLPDWSMAKVPPLATTVDPIPCIVPFVQVTVPVMLRVPGPSMVPPSIATPLPNAAPSDGVNVPWIDTLPPPVPPNVPDPLSVGMTSVPAMTETVPLLVNPGAMVAVPVPDALVNVPPVLLLTIVPEQVKIPGSPELSPL